MGLGGIKPRAAKLGGTTRVYQHIIYLMDFYRSLCDLNTEQFAKSTASLEKIKLLYYSILIQEAFPDGKTIFCVRYLWAGCRPPIPFRFGDVRYLQRRCALGRGRLS